MLHNCDPRSRPVHDGTGPIFRSSQQVVGRYLVLRSLSTCLAVGEVYYNWNRYTSGGGVNAATPATTPRNWVAWVTEGGRDRKLRKALTTLAL